MYGIYTIKIFVFCVSVGEFEVSHCIAFQIIIYILSDFYGDTFLGDKSFWH